MIHEESGWNNIQIFYFRKSCQWKRKVTNVKQLSGKVESHNKVCIKLSISHRFSQWNFQIFIQHVKITLKQNEGKCTVIKTCDQYTHIQCTTKKATKLSKCNIISNGPSDVEINSSVTTCTKYTIRLGQINWYVNRY